MSAAVVREKGRRTTTKGRTAGQFGPMSAQPCSALFWALRRWASARMTSARKTGCPIRKRYCFSVIERDGDLRFGDGARAARRMVMTPSPQNLVLAERLGDGFTNRVANGARWMTKSSAPRSPSRKTVAPALFSRIGTSGRRSWKLSGFVMSSSRASRSARVLPSLVMDRYHGRRASVNGTGSRWLALPLIFQRWITLERSEVRQMGFPNRRCSDSTCWLGGGQQGWRVLIRRTCATG